MQHLKKSVISVFLFFGAMSAVAASPAYYTRNYAVKFHFYNTYYGQPVTNVMAHVGVDRDGTWYNTQDFNLQPAGYYRSYFGQTTIKDQYTSASRSAGLLKVAYEVTLHGGAKVWTEAFPVIGEELVPGHLYEGRNSSDADPKISDAWYTYNRYLEKGFSYQTECRYFTTYH